MGALAEETKGDKDQAPSPLVTIKVTLQCRGDDCSRPASSPILAQISGTSSPLNYPNEYKDPPIDAKTIGELTLDKTLAGTLDFRVDGDHLFKPKNVSAHPPGTLETQSYNLAVSTKERTRLSSSCVVYRLTTAKSQPRTHV